MNELLIFLTLAVSFGMTLLFYRLFSKAGLYAWISICAILANIEVTVLVKAFGMTQTLGNTLFASSFLATDILSELHSKQDAEKGVKIGIATSVVFILFSIIWQFYTPAESDWAYPSVRTLFSNTPRIMIASLIAYAVSEFVDVKLYHLIWNFTEQKSGDKKSFLWLRNNAATLIAQAVNIVIFNFGAFFGIYEIGSLLSITATCYVIYIFTSLLDTPFIYLARKNTNRNISDKN